MKKNSTSTNLKSKLKNYSLMATAALASGVANADIYYSEINQTVNTDGGGYSFDINCDGTNDIRFSLTKSTGDAFYTFPGYQWRTSTGTFPTSFSYILSSGVTRKNRLKVERLNNNLDIIQDNSLSSFAERFNAGQFIDNGKVFNANPLYLASFSSIASGAGGQSSNGDWFNSNAHYLGLRIKIGSDFHYGWIRLQTPNNAGSITVLRSVVNKVPNEQITTGLVHVSDGSLSNQIIYSDTAKVVTMADINDTDGAADLKVTFQAKDTIHTEEHRIFVIPKNTKTLDICTVWQETQYKAVKSELGTGSLGAYTYNINMSGAKDVNGNTIVNGQEYDIWIYSVSRGANAEPLKSNTRSNMGSLIKAGSTIKLMGKAEPVANLTASDIGNNEDISDLRVTFNEHATNVSKNGSYKVFVVKSAKATTFNLAASNAVTSGNYKTVAVTSANASKTVNYVVGDKDTDGDSLEHCTDYTVFVQTLANGTTADRDTLMKSNSVNLKGIVDSVSSVLIKDIDDYQDGRDLEYTFNGALDESTILEYRVFAVKQSSWPLNINLAASNNNCKRITPIGLNKYKGTFKGIGVTDSDGGLIQNGTTYKIYVVAIADGVCDTIHTISSSIGLTLDTYYPDCVDASTIIASDSGDANNGSDIYVEFTATTNYVGAFHVIAVNNWYANFLTESGFPPNYMGSKDLVKFGYSTVLYPSDGVDVGGGQFLFKTRLKPTAGDEEGNSIASGRDYKIFIVAQGDGVVSYIDCLSDPSDSSVTLLNYTGVAESLEGKVGLITNGSSITVNFDKSLVLNGSLQVFNTLGQNVISMPVNQRQITIDNFNETGIYILTINMGNAVLSRRIYIQK